MHPRVCVLQKLVSRSAIASTQINRSFRILPLVSSHLCLRTAGPVLYKRNISSSMPNHKSVSKDAAKAADDPHQFQAGATTHRKEDEWKHREPYRIHDDDEDFPVKWKGGCHCGKIKYQLSREKPLAVKYCHCTTCQRLHGVSNPIRKFLLLKLIQY